jgi:hypothetical protein
VTLSSSTCSLERTGTPHAQEHAPGASNPRASEQLGAWVRCKTERGDRGDRDDVLTSGGDGREWPDFGEDGRGRPWWPARSLCIRRRCWTGRQGAMQAEAAGVRVWDSRPQLYRARRSRPGLARMPKAAASVS